MTTTDRTAVRLSASVSALAIGLVATSSALAQSANAAQGQAAVMPPPPATTQDIVVTAQRRSERLVDVPIAVSSVSAAKLESSGVASVLNLPQTATGLRLDYSGPYVQPTIRGVGSPLVGPGLNSNVAVYVDGFYVPNPLGTDFQLLSVTGVQVLKGPQGTLFGRNATGGAILVTTSDPSFDPTMTTKISYSSFNKVNASTYMSAGSGMFAANIAAFYERGDGYITNINTGQKVSQYRKWTVHPKLLFKPSDTVSFVLGYQHSIVNDPSPFLTSSYDGLTSAQYLAPGVPIATGSKETSNGAPAKSTLNSNLVTLTGKADFGFATLSSYTQYRNDKSNLAGDYDGTIAPIMAPRWRVWDKTFTQELNLASKQGGPLTWVTGLYYYHNKNQYPGYIVTIGGGAPFEYFRSISRTKSYAAFADATYEVLDHLFLTGGLRYSVDKTQGQFLCSACGGLAGEGSKTFRKLTPRANVRYELGRATNVYFSYNKGYKSGFIPVSAFSTVPIKPEGIDAYEVGFKTARGPFHFDTSAYYYKYSNLQVAAYVNSAAVYRNAKKAEIYGGDAQISADLTRDLSLSLGVTYTHAQYKQFGDAVDYVQDTNKFLPGTDTPNPSYGLFLHPNVPVDGNVMPRSPRFSGTASADYKHKFGWGDIHLDANLFYTSKFYFDSPERFSQKRYALLNLRAGYTTPDGHFGFDVFGTNVTNSKYRIQVLPGDFAIQQVYGEPASVGASFTVHY
ncbi:TonB-dependent receptor [Sphingomonas sp. CGMCC 1.13654]|uniref:TonB-dependent receptor n=1 Tax=Sphingomonas chungangi TaxID=2683589 RepID=A0A838L439_9SPHN|nr:TonB-dependent receptor [Sphingomonas chungangi]MBA2933807.1 TonB-dependent receptor [Sphingomonas chungangi]